MVDAFDATLSIVVGEATKKEDPDLIDKNTKINNDLITGNDAQSTGNAGHGHTGSGDGIPIVTAAITDNNVTTEKLEPTQKNYLLEYDNDPTDPGSTPIYTSTGDLADKDTILDTNTWWDDKMIRLTGKLAVMGGTAAAMTTEIHVDDHTTNPSGAGVNDFKYSVTTIADRIGGSNNIVSSTLRITTTENKITPDIAVTYGGTTDTYSFYILANGSGQLVLRLARDAANYGNNIYIEYQISIEVIGAILGVV